ncbi:phage tail protein [Dyella flagellata]|uniref:Phage tail protein domain-containing protein n=1 Tax=Dyella flagellata TaxID=1867833 RepID=A0ABQ5XE04_9GAMM|nr:phage tail protein [Dyella flagellata]GLQ89921.1 hypothetical protein GCM10007898_34960 [Dyella flagellata]
MSAFVSQPGASTPVAPSAPARVPSPPQLPNDPLSLLLNARVGWRMLDDSGVRTTPDGAITLPWLAGSERSFGEASGSFGGLCAPWRAAIDDSSSLYVLDAFRYRLKHFDPCRCGFVALPCIGGHGGGARQLRKPGGIAVHKGLLYICDSGLDGLTQTGSNPRRQALRERIRGENHRVSVFLLNGYALRGHLRPPREKYPHWKPRAVACDAHGGVWVTDIANQCVHHFGANGHWRGTRGPSFNQPLFISVDRCGAIYVVDLDPVKQTPRLQTMQPDGVPLLPPQSVEAGAKHFAALPFTVLANGTLDLRALCATLAGEVSGYFDADGDPLKVAPAAPVQYFETDASFVSGPLDSKLLDCQWHRLLLRGELPQGCSVLAQTFCADEIYNGDQLDGFAQWQPLTLAQPLTPPRNGTGKAWSWDGLIRSPPGRYLWLRIALHGTGKATPVLRAMEVEFPRITSLRYLPAVFAIEPVSADFTARFLALFDTTLRSIEHSVDTLPRWFDPMSTPAKPVGNARIDFLSWLASWIGLSLPRNWSEARKRDYVRRAGKLYARRGTPRGLRDMLLLFLGWGDAAQRYSRRPTAHRCNEEPRNCRPLPPCVPYQPPPLVLEHFKLRRWLQLGAGRLGEKAELWGRRLVNRSQLNTNARTGDTRLLTTPDAASDPVLLDANQITVFVPARYRDPAQRRSLQQWLRSECPAYVLANIEYVEPRMRIGVQSMIGFDSVIARLPQGVALGGNALGNGTVLTGAAPAKPPAARIGRDSRIGNPPTL